MKSTFLPVLALMLATASVRGEDAIRTWTSLNGQTVEASFVKEEYMHTYLAKPNGTEFRIATSKLSKADREYVRKQVAEARKMKASADAGGEEGDLPEAPEAIQKLFGSKLTNARKKNVSVNALTGKTIGVYFSAHWCPPCRAFTPGLVDFYNTLSKKEKPFEIVFVSSDRDKKAMYGYMKEMDMPWLALPFGDEHKQSLATKFKVRGIPKLVILNAKGELVTENGRGDVSGRGVAAYEAWQ